VSFHILMDNTGARPNLGKRYDFHPSSILSALQILIPRFNNSRQMI